MLKKITTWYKNHPDKKRLLDYMTAALSIPLILTVIISNVLNIKSKQESEKKNSENQTVNQIVSSPVAEKVVEKVTILPIEVTRSEKENPTTSECKKDIGPIEITEPKEDEEVSKEPVCVQVRYDQGDYCSVVWSYRINSGSWSDYDNNSFCLYNLPAGKNKVELKIKSVATNKEVTLVRNFTVKQTDTPSPTLSPTPISQSISPTNPI